MRELLFFYVLLGLGACSTDKADRGSELADGSTVYTLRCPTDWSGCYTDAKNICGHRGFVEVDRFSAGSIGNSGRLDDTKNAHSQGSGVYREDIRQDDYDRVLTIRCN